MRYHLILKSALPCVIATLALGLSVPAPAQQLTEQTCRSACAGLDEIMLKFTPPNRCECECKPGFKRPKEGAACVPERLRDVVATPPALLPVQDACVSRNVRSRVEDGSLLLVFTTNRCRSGVRIALCIWNGQQVHTGPRQMLVDRQTVEFIIGTLPNRPGGYQYAWTTGTGPCSIDRALRRPLPASN